MVRRFGAVLVVLGALGLVVVAAAPAGAQCVGQLVRYDPAEVTRGDRVLISGNSYDARRRGVRRVSRRGSAITGAGAGPCS